MAFSAQLGRIKNGKLKEVDDREARSLFHALAGNSPEDTLPTSSCKHLWHLMGLDDVDLRDDRELDVETFIMFTGKFLDKRGGGHQAKCNSTFSMLDGNKKGRVSVRNVVDFVGQCGIATNEEEARHYVSHVHR